MDTFYENLLREIKEAAALDSSTIVYLNVINELMMESLRVDFDDAIFSLIYSGYKPANIPSIRVLLTFFKPIDNLSREQQLSLFSNLLTEMTPPVS